MTEYALTIKLMDETSSAHSFNPYAYFGHSWSYFDIQNIYDISSTFRGQKYIFGIFTLRYFHIYFI